MQTPLCILIIALSLILFGIGMFRDGSKDQQSIDDIESMLRAQGGDAASAASANATAEADPPKVQIEKLPLANEKATASLLIELPPAKYPRSKLESLTIKESYLSLHKEFITGRGFFEHLAAHIRKNLETRTFLAGSLVDGPIPVIEILRNRLFFHLEGNSNESKPPSLVLEAMGETSAAAEKLADLAQAEYLRYVKMSEGVAFHPRLVQLAAKLKQAGEENRSLENDLAAYRQIHKTPPAQNKEKEIETLLAACRSEKSRYMGLLGEISEAFASNLQDVEDLADLRGLGEFENIHLLRENIRQLEKSTAKYRANGNMEAVSEHKKTAQDMQEKLFNEINLAITELKNRLQSLLDREIALSEQMAALQNDFAELAMQYPKADLLYASRRSIANLEDQLKRHTLIWEQARKNLVVGYLSKSIPSLQLQILAP